MGHKNYKNSRLNISERDRQDQDQELGRDRAARNRRKAQEQENDKLAVTISVGVLIGLVAATFAVSKFLDGLHGITGNSLFMALCMITFAIFGWLACQLYEGYFRPLILRPLQRERNRRAALKELGLDYLIDDSQDPTTR